MREDRTARATSIAPSYAAVPAHATCGAGSSLWRLPEVGVRRLVLLRSTSTALLGSGVRLSRRGIPGGDRLMGGATRRHKRCNTARRGPGSNSELCGLSPVIPTDSPGLRAAHSDRPPLESCQTPCTRSTAADPVYRGAVPVSRRVGPSTWPTSPRATSARRPTGSRTARGPCRRFPATGGGAHCRAQGPAGYDAHGRRQW